MTDKSSRVTKICLVFANLLAITGIYIVSFQSIRESGSNDKTVLLPLVYFTMLFIVNCVLLIVFYLTKSLSLIPFQKIILLAIMIIGTMAVYIFSK